MPTSESRKLLVLVDMDSVLADFELALLTNFRKKYPDEPFIPLEERRGFLAYPQYDQLKPGLGAKCIEVTSEPRFFLDMKTIPGCVEAMWEMASMENVEVFLCTSPITNYKHCVTEKYQWVEKHLGRDWVNRLILTKDKTMVKGDILIDDKPVITGAVQKPEWTHYLMECPSNTDADNVKRLKSWVPEDGWKKIVYDELAKLS